MHGLSQTWAVTRVGLMSLRQRWSSSAVVVFGNAGVVAVLISVLAMASGFRATVERTGHPDRAIVMRGGAASELTSVLTRDAVERIEDTKGVRWSGGRPVSSAELVMVTPVDQVGGHERIDTTLRGIGPRAMELRPELHITEGRMFARAKRELIIGRAVQSQYPFLKVGSDVAFGNGQWRIVGVFASGGDSHESEMMGDVTSVADAFRRRSFNSLTVQLVDMAAFDGFRAALLSDPTLTVDVVRESDYFAGLSAHLNHLLVVVGLLVGTIMSIGAIFGALNTMYAAVSARRTELATLRAIGFARGPVVGSIVLEAVWLGIAGGVLGAVLAWVLFNGRAVESLSGANVQVVFRMAARPGMVTLGLGIATVISCVGGIIPAVRATRRPVAESLRSL